MIALAAGALGMAPGPQRTPRRRCSASSASGASSRRSSSTGSTLEWVSFTTAAVAALLATVGLTIHELTTERVVHELSVITRERDVAAY